MPNQKVLSEKQAVVEALKQRIASAQSGVLVDYKGINVTNDTILRRRLRGEPIFKPDKGHLHHQLYSLGMGQRRTVLMIYGVCSVMGVAAIIFSRRLYIESAFLFIVALLFIFTLVWGWNKSKKKKS